MEIRTVQTENAPKAVGPYAQATVYGNLVFCSGQVPLDPGTGELAGSTPEEQAQQCLKNLQAVLSAAGSSLQQALKITIYITDMKQFSVINKVYGQFLQEPYPARACIEVSGLPKGADVEMEAIAFTG